MKSVINLVKTSNGYSLVEGDSLINKTATKINKERGSSTQKKLVQNFTIYPYLSTQEKDQNNKYIIIPGRAQWFSLTTVHEIQKKALPQWFKQKKTLFGTVKQEKFEKNEQLYKKYRNHIIDLAKHSYLSAFKARSGLAGDACAIIRIHQFLEKWGLINYVYNKPNNHTQIRQSQQKNHNLPLRKDCFDRDKNLVAKSYNKQDLELLRKISRQMRLHCHYCEGVCGIIWYEYNQKVFLKHFGENGITRSTQPMEYCLRLCASCYFQGNIPLIFSMNDFQKVTLIDNINEDQKDKKKASQSTKIVQLMQKYKLNYTKTAKQLKIDEEAVFKSLIHTPAKKIQRLKKVQIQTDAQGDKQEGATNFTNAINKQVQNEEVKSNGLSNHYKDSQFVVLESQKKIYEEMIQYWLEKTSLKLQKLRDWDKTVNWTAQHCLSLQKSTIADHIKNMISK